MPYESEKQFEGFAKSVAIYVEKTIDRAVCFMWYHHVQQGKKNITFQDIKKDFETAGLRRPNVTKLRYQLSRNRRTAKNGKDCWLIPTDKLPIVEHDFELTDYVSTSTVSSDEPLKHGVHSYVNLQRLESIKTLHSTKYDFARLVELLDELNSCHASKSYIAVISLLRAVLDHVPPIFGYRSFAEVSNNYAGTRSFKDSMKRLNESSRKIADTYLHTQIRKKESLPNETQVDFSNDLDVLISEIVRLI